MIAVAYKLPSPIPSTLPLVMSKIIRPSNINVRSNTHLPINHVAKSRAKLTTKKHSRKAEDPKSVRELSKKKETFRKRSHTLLGCFSGVYISFFSFSQNLKIPLPFFADTTHAQWHTRTLFFIFFVSLNYSSFESPSHSLWDSDPFL